VSIFSFRRIEEAYQNEISLKKTPQTRTALEPLMQGGRVSTPCNSCVQPRTIPTMTWNRSLGCKNSEQPSRHSLRRTHAALISPVDTTMSAEEVAEGEGVIDWRQRWSASPNPLIDPFMLYTSLFACSTNYSACISWRNSQRWWPNAFIWLVMLHIRNNAQHNTSFIIIHSGGRCILWIRCQRTTPGG
jgi:hypothetical protein